ncbi:MAG: hypothetical protein KA746_13295 [Pyrinomonadaceae bacterium]|nr:hypothetical protein [Pyrinomonadaceae bacterium]MBP6212674.1 hypothetical protein [Pyrinomonadaceae bacterium]
MQDESAIDIEVDELDIIETETRVVARRRPRPAASQAALKTYIFLPAIFLAVTLLGGLRIGAVDSAFIFLKPALICLVFASAMIVLFVRSGLVDLAGWFSEDFSTLRNVANAGVLLTIFTATTQIFNSLIPEQGLPFWVIAFCFLWTIWNNLFLDFDTKKLLRSLGGMFVLAFFAKYLVLANLTTSGDAGWLQRIFENPAKETFTWLLELPRYSPATGYLQFLALALYLLGLFLTPRTTNK